MREAIIVEYRQMKYLLTIAESGSITAAAEKLFISQPALSAFVRKTEKSLGAELFDRSTAPITLTYAGRIYIKTAERIVRIYEKMLRQLEDISEEKAGRLAVGMPVMLHAYCAPELERRARSCMGNTELEVIVSDEDELIRKLVQRQLNMVILSLYKPIPDFVCVEIASENLYVIARHEYIGNTQADCADDDVIHLNQIADCPVFTRPASRRISSMSQQVFDSAAIIPSNLVECPSQASEIMLSISGHGISIVPEHVIRVIRTEKTVQQYRLDEQFSKAGIYAVFAKDTYVGRLERAYMQMIKDSI